MVDAVGGVGDLCMGSRSSKCSKCRLRVSKPGELFEKSAQKLKNTPKKNTFAFLIKFSPLFVSNISDSSI
jgi:hypothetical protein